MFLWNWLKALGGLIKKAFGYAQRAGLTDEVLKRALELVRQAAEQFEDNTERREFVIAALMRLGLPERLARLAVELAVMIWKKEG